MSGRESGGRQAESAAVREISAETTRRVSSRAQRLRDPLEDARDIVGETGFLRTLGGSDVYLALRARHRDPLERTEVDELVARGELRVVPAVRGCIYLVTREQAPWALRIADALSASRRRREYAKVGLDPEEIATLGDAVETVLERGPLSTDALRRRLPADAIRSFGDLGKKVGLSSSLPPVLRELEFAGRIFRTLEHGRLDSEKYVWELAPEDEHSEVRGEETEGVADSATLAKWLARQLLQWIGVVRLEAFQTWSGFGKKVCRTALENCVEQGLAHSVDAAGAAAWAAVEALPSGELDSAHDRLSFLPFEDNLTQLQGGAAAVVPERHLHHRIPRWGQSKKMVPLGEAQHLGLRAIVRGGELVGFWEVDLATGGAVTTTLDPPTGKQGDRIVEEADRAARFLLEEIGNPFWFSIDKEASVERRAELIRKLDF